MSMTPSPLEPSQNLWASPLGPLASCMFMAKHKIRPCFHSFIQYVPRGKPGAVLEKNRLNNKQKPPSLSREREINNDSEAQL